MISHHESSIYSLQKHERDHPSPHQEKNFWLVKEAAALAPFPCSFQSEKHHRLAVKDDALFARGGEISD
jgi:hypothetical protein